MNKFACAVLTCAALGWIVQGCAPSAPPPPPAATTGPAHDHDHGHDHAHPAHGPHEGHLLELGSGKYHAEVVHDDAAKTVTIYLLGEDSKTPAPIAEESLVISAVVDGKPQQFQLAAKPLEGEADGQSSRYHSSDPTLAAACDDAMSKARLSVTIEGRPYNVAVEPHGH